MHVSMSTKFMENNNLVKVTVGTLELWFSYNECIAFAAPGYGLVVHENDWGVGTGRHLNAIDGGGNAPRFPHGEFTRLLEEVDV
jgi:hypothetical protein